MVHAVRDRKAFSAMSSIREQYASQIAEKRRSLGLTQQQLAELVGTRKSNISRIESGRQNFSLDILQKMMDALQMEAEPADFERTAKSVPAGPEMVTEAAPAASEKAAETVPAVQDLNGALCAFYASQIAERMGLAFIKGGLIMENGSAVYREDTSGLDAYEFMPFSSAVPGGGLNAWAEYCAKLGQEQHDAAVSTVIYHLIVNTESSIPGQIGFLRDKSTGEICGVAPARPSGECFFYGSSREEITGSAGSSDRDSSSALAEFCGADATSACRRLMGSVQRQQLRNLIHFSFSESDVCAFPSWRIRAMESRVQRILRSLIL